MNAAEKTLIETQTSDFIDFVSASPTSYHAAQAAGELLRAAGFTQLSETEAWSGRSGNYFFIRGGALIAWRLPSVSNLPADLSSLQPKAAGPALRFRVVGAHTDSPALRLKPQPDAENYGWGQIGVEIYGGPLWTSWLNRDLAVAGRLIDAQGRSHLVHTPPLAVIPQLAPHLDRSVNPEGLKLDPQQHLHPLWYGQHLRGADAAQGTGGAGGILEQVAAVAGLRAEQVDGFDLFMVDTQRPQLLGEEGSLLASGRLDNLSSSHPALLALLDQVKTDQGEGGEKDAFGWRPGDEEVPCVQVVVLFDHEEVGSQTSSGAMSPLLAQTLERIAASVEVTGQAYWQALAASSVVSADAAHLVNPNYAGKHDPQHQPVAGGGPVLKVNAQARYATDGIGQALWERACRAAEVPHQVFVSNNAVPCGTTIGPITAGMLGITTVDVGAGILSMHSVREICAPLDLYYLRRALGAYLAGA